MEMSTKDVSVQNTFGYINFIFKITFFHAKKTYPS